MAKKRKVARAAASRGAKNVKKKTTAGKKKAVKRAVKRAAAPAYMAGLENPREVNFKPLKKHVSAIIARLDSAAVMTPGIENALKSLRQVQVDLNNECDPTMILPTP